MHRTKTKNSINTTPYKSPVPCQESPPSAAAFSEHIDTLIGPGHFAASMRHASSQPNPPSLKHSTPAPVELPDDLRLLFSTLGRDAILAYAHRLYESQSVSGPSTLSAAPVFTPSPATAITKDNIYTSHLLPLLVMLRKSHPEHSPTMLLLSCVHYAMGDYEASLALNERILSLEPQSVSEHSTPHTYSFFGLTSLTPGRSHV